MEEKKTNRFSKVIHKLFGKMRYFLIPLILSVVFMTCVNFVGRYVYTTNLNLIYTSFVSNNIYDVFINNSGKMLAVEGDIDQGSTEIVDLASGRTESFYGGNLQSKLKNVDIQGSYQGNDLIIGDDGYLYYSVSVWTDDLAWLKSEKILKLSSDFKYQGTVCTVEPDDSMIRRYQRVGNISYYDDSLYFAVLDNDGVFHYKINTKTNDVDISKLFATGEDGIFTGSVYTYNDKFFHVLSDGSCHMVDFDGNEDVVIYTPSNDTDSKDYILLSKFCMIQNEIYALDSLSQKVYKINDGKLTKILDLADYYAVETLQYMRDSNRVHLNTYQNKLYVSGMDGLLICDQSGITEQEVAFYITRFDTILSILYCFVRLVAVLSVIGIVINIFIRKKNLMFKQLVTIIPCCMIMSLLMFYNIFTYAEKLQIKQTESELQAVTELVSTELDEFDFTGMNINDEETSKKYKQLNDILDKITIYNSSDWSKLYSFEVGRRNAAGEVKTIAFHDKTVVPNSILLTVPTDDEFAEKGSGNRKIIIDSQISNYIFAESNIGDGISSYAPIYDKDGNITAYLYIRTDILEFENQRLELAAELFKGVFIMSAVIILVITILTIKLTTTIKKTTRTVSEIAKGDFGVRTQYKSDDELGEICNQVNTMAENLKELFDEKDETEKFYYKFVPEKFKELLGKDKFTDLQLGDAESKDITVLFCDIRSFSINSEIMTAKENFEFVNAIFGKAGPIVRKHNGFVDKYIGDAVMALFENADDAVACGIELYKEIALSDELAESLKMVDINIGVGIHSGMARIGIVGEDERLSGTVISDTVNLSSRFESLTKQYQTAMIISKDTIDRMKDPDSVNIRYLGMITAAGVNDARAIFEVLDCLPDEERKVKMANTSDFREAIRLFQLGRRSEALNRLSLIKEKNQADYVVDMYYNYISSLSAEDKSNVIRFDKK